MTVLKEGTEDLLAICLKPKKREDCGGRLEMVVSFTKIQVGAQSSPRRRSGLQLCPALQ